MSKKTKAPELAGREADRQRLKESNFFTDVFMRIAVQRNIMLLESILRTITGKLDLKLKSMEGQKSIVSGYRKEVRLDIYAVAEDGSVYDVEFQNERAGADPRRTMAHAGMIMRYLLRTGEKIPKVHEEVNVIFLTSTDYMKTGDATHTYAMLPTDKDGTTSPAFPLKVL